MVLNVWLSIQTDYGITMGEMGSLSSETDSKLIASTLMALKDIVSVEASAGESQFMTGSVEMSSFGTFAIAVDQETKIIMSYIVSAESGDTVDQDTVQLVQTLCNNLGRQLSLSVNVVELAKSGAAIPRKLMTRAYLNAITIVIMAGNYQTDPKSLRRAYVSAVDKTMREKAQFSEMVQEMIPDNFLNNSDFWYTAYLTEYAHDYFYDELTEYILYLTADYNPLIFLRSANPKNELQRIRQYLSQIFEKSGDDHKSVIKHMGPVFRDEWRDYVDKLTILENHLMDSYGFEYVVRKATLLAMKEQPFIAFRDLRRAPIFQEYQRLRPDTSFPDAPELFSRLIERESDSLFTRYVWSFYDGFRKGIIGIPLSKPGVDLMVKFAENFLNVHESMPNLKSRSSIDRKYIAQLSEFIDELAVTALKVQNIQEATLLQNAATNSIADTIAEIIYSNFFFSDTHPQTLYTIAKYYSSVGPKVKTASILQTMLQIVGQCNTHAEFMTPSYRDLIASAIMRNTYNIYTEDQKYDVGKKLFGSYVISTDAGKVPFQDYYHNFKSIKIIIDGQEIAINMDQVEVEPFARLINDVEVVIEAVKLAGQRRSNLYILPSFDDWKDKIDSHIDNIIKDLEKKRNLSDISQVNDEVPNYTLPSYNFGNTINSLIHTEFDETKQDLKKVLQNILADLVSEVSKRGEINSKIVKKVNKSKEELWNIIDNHKESMKNTLVGVAEKAQGEINRFSDQIEDAIRSKNPEILRYNYNITSLLTPPDEAVERIQNFVLQDEQYKAYTQDRFSKALAMTLFKTSPDIAFEPTYNEILSKEMSVQTQKIFEEASSKRQFDDMLKSTSTSFKKEIYELIKLEIQKLTNMYVNKNGLVTSDKNKVRLIVGTIPIDKFPRQKFIDQISSLEGMKISRDGSVWNVNYEFTTIESVTDRLPNIVTFSDAVNYLIRQEFLHDSKDIFEALASVAGLIEDVAALRVREIRDEIANAIFEI